MTELTEEEQDALNELKGEAWENMDGIYEDMLCDVMEYGQSSRGENMLHYLSVISEIHTGLEDLPMEGIEDPTEDPEDHLKESTLRFFCEFTEDMVESLDYFIFDVNYNPIRHLGRVMNDFADTYKK